MINLISFELNNVYIYFFDIVFLLIFVLYIYEQIQLGLLFSISNLISLLTSLLLGLLLYRQVSTFLLPYTNLPHGIANALCFFFVTLLFWIIVMWLCVATRLKFKLKVRNFYATKIIAGLTGSVSYILLSTIFILLIISFPTNLVIKSGIKQSYLGRTILNNSQGLEQIIKQVFGQAIDETMSFLTVKPQTNEIIELHFKPVTFEKDIASEQEMFKMLNKERQASSLEKLIWSNALAEAGRDHALDMAKKSYFGHMGLDGRTPLDRLNKKPITFTLTGENLALAPDAQIAMQGLMKSKGHRQNMLSPEFRRVGVGVIDLGIYGKIFVQEFAD